MNIPLNIRVGKERIAVLCQHIGKHVFIAYRVWKHRKQTEIGVPTPEEAEFLPSALALQETPPSPIPRAGAWLLSVLTVFVLVYCIVAKVDIIVVGDGVIVERTHSRIISATTTARLLRFRVAEGDTVHAGQSLVDLDEEFAYAEVQRLVREHEDARLEAIRSSWILRSLDSGKIAVPNRDPDIPMDRWNGTLDLMRATSSAYQTDLARRDAIVSQKRAELATAQEAEQRMRDVIAISRERESDVARLAKDRVVSKHDAMDQRQDLTDKEGELRTQIRRIQELKESIVVLIRERTSAEAAIRKELLEATKSNFEKNAQLEKELDKSRAILGACHLVSPIDGTVQQLALQLVGGVALPGNQVLVVVPTKRDLHVDAKVLNQDIGFLVPGMDASIKVAAFPYTKYGTIPGRITKISDDALPDEKLGLVFQVSSNLQRDEIRLERKSIRLSPGLQVSLEVRTGERRLIEYFLAPFLQKASESFRER